MSTEEVILFFTAIIAWDTLWLQLLIIPFVQKGETLQRDYITSGVLGTALSFIETKKLIPGLANMFVRIRGAQSNGRKKLREEELQQILEQIDYLPDLKLAQDAMDQNNELKALFDALQNASRRVWSWGLGHVIIMLCLPMALWIPGGYDLIIMVTIVILAIITCIRGIGAFLFFHKQMRQFLGLLKHSR